MEVEERSNVEHRICNILEETTSDSQKLDLLGLLDATRVQYYHWMTVIVAGCGFYTGAYDLFCISTISNLVGRLYFYDPSSHDPSQPGEMSMQMLALLNSIALFGALTGSLFFGFWGDKVGRKRTYTLTLVFMIFGSIGSGLAYAKDAKMLVYILCFFRFWLAFGIGGDHPAAATVMAEYANVKSRGACISAMFAMQGCGMLSCAGVTIVVAESFKKFFPCGKGPRSTCIPPSFDTPKQADYVWRIIILVGAIPALFTLYFRAKLPETPRYTVLVEGDAQKATKNMNKLLNVRLSASLEEGKRWKTIGGSGICTREFASKFGWRLVAVCCSHFLLDISFYSQARFQRDVLTDVGWLPPTNQMNGLSEASLVSQATAILALVASVPGYWVTVCTVDWLGRRLIQLQGFFFLTIICLAIGIKFYSFRGEYCGTAMQAKWCGGYPMIFIALYGAMFFFFNFGANSTTSILPAELFPARHRCMCVGISGFIGKIGALCATFGFMFFKRKLQIWPVRNLNSNSKTNGVGFEAGYMLLASCSALGFFITFFLIPETAGQSLEALTFEETIGDPRTEPSHKVGTVTLNSADHVVNDNGTQSTN